jgi:hypothetical protein
MIEVRDDQLRQLILHLQETLHPEAIKEIMESGLEVGLAEAQITVKGTAYDTGDLYNSLGKKMISNNEGMLFATADHAKPVEFGTYKMPARPYLEPAAIRAFMFIQDAISNALESGVSKGVGRPTTTGAGTYTPTGNRVGRPSSSRPDELNQYKDHKESDRKTQRKYISKRKSPSTGKWIYEYGDQPRLRTARVRKTDRRVRRTGQANRGQ